MTTAQLTRIATHHRTTPANTLSIWRAVRGIWKKNRNHPLTYQRAVRKERDI